MAKLLFNKGKGWTAFFDVLAKGWQIRWNDINKTPICIVPEPQGGEKNEAGRSPHQEWNAKLIKEAPELLEIAIDFVRKVDEGKAKSTKTYGAMKAVLERLELY